jgi:CheY-like chemotaxis protein
MTRHVLIVDDVMTNRMLPGMILRGLGDVIHECGNGEEAMALLAQEPITHVLLDISLPKVSGVDICRQIRQTPAWAQVRLIAYTAHGMEQQTHDFLAAGFDHVLVKPIRRDDLLKALA